MYNIGIDMATVSRIEKSCQKESFRNHVFTQAELDLFFNREKPKYSSLAANFAAKEAFSEYLNSTMLDSRQIYFVNQIVEYIVLNGMMKDLAVLRESPFNDNGSIIDIFTDLSVWNGILSVINRVNSNAAG